MSHAHGGHDSCSLRFRIRLLHSIPLSLARGMTDVGVGSGALLGLYRSERDNRPHRNTGLEGSTPPCFFAETTPAFLKRFTRGIIVSAAAATSFTRASRCRSSESSYPWCAHGHSLFTVLPNVKDEPRPRPA